MATRKPAATTVEHANLNAARLAIQQAMPAFQRDSINPHFGSQYLTLEALLPQVLDVVNAHGVIVAQWPTVVGNVGGLRTRLTHAATGEFEEDTMLLAAGKETPQAQGSAISFAKRYALMAALGITADKDDDANAAMPARPQPTAQGQSASAVASAVGFGTAL